MKKVIIYLIVSLLPIIGWAQEIRKDSIRLIDNGALCDSMRYNLHGTKWNKSTLNYYIYNTSVHLTSTDCEQALCNAFTTWSNHSNILFVRVYNQNDADIHIKWVTGNHGDNSSFDGNGGVLAHAYYPAEGDFSGHLHFDDDESWSVDGTGIDVESVALHEIGHLLGLSHSEESDAVMNAYYSDIKRDLNIDDCLGIWNLYGSPLAINGPSGPCGLAAYSISKIPEYCSVAWSFVSNTPEVPHFQIGQNYYIDNSNYLYIEGVLTAIVSYNGNVIETLHLTVDNVCNTFYGTYSQSTLYSVVGTSTYQSGTFGNKDNFRVLRGNNITLVSSYFSNASLTKNVIGETLSSWNHMGNTITFRFRPTTHLMGKMNIQGVKDSKIFNFSVIAVPVLGIRNNWEMQLTNKEKNKYLISLIPDGEWDDGIENSISWIFQMKNIVTGENYLNIHVKGCTLEICTDKYASGLYLFCAQIGDQKLCKKVQITK